MQSTHKTKTKTSSSQVRKLGIGNGGVRAKFGRFESGMEEFELRSDAWNREWRSSSQVRTLGIGNSGVREKFQSLELENGGVRAKFGHLELELEEFEPSSDTWNWEWRSSSQVPTLGIGNG